MLLPHTRFLGVDKLEPCSFFVGLVNEVFNLLSHTCFLGVKLSPWFHFGEVLNISFNIYYETYISDSLNFLF
jgi:hypothetical protein